MRLQVAIACFLILFGAVELLQWFQKRNLPMPVLVLSGIALSVASNYEKLSIVSEDSPWANRLREYLPKAIFEDNSQDSEPE
jgi:hypothetical protein